jgi:glycosyltransferase involved in cell wall biosynthesis
MPVYNCAATLPYAIASIILQDFKDWELILIDDDSGDSTWDVCKRFRDERIRIYRDGKNKGLAERLNETIDLANGHYFARMDTDDVSYPERLEIQYAFLEKHRGVDLVGSKALMFRGEGEAVGVMPAVAAHEAIFAAHLNGAFPLYHPTWMGRIEWFRRHAYDPAFRKAQDYELLLRASRTSTYANVQEVLLGYRSERSSFQKQLTTRRFVLRAQVKNLLRRGEWLSFLYGALITCVKGASDAAFTVMHSAANKEFRLAPLRPDQIERWAGVWHGVRS